MAKTSLTDGQEKLMLFLAEALERNELVALPFKERQTGHRVVVLGWQREETDAVSFLPIAMLFDERHDCFATLEAPNEPTIGYSLTEASTPDAQEVARMLKDCHKPFIN